MERFAYFFTPDYHCSLWYSSYFCGELASFARLQGPLDFERGNFFVSFRIKRIPTSSRLLGEIQPNDSSGYPDKK